MATILNKVTNLMLIVLASFLLYGLGINATLPRFKQETKEDGSLSFLVIGDWGRKGTFNQSLVATQMGIVGEKLDVDFIISTGDNFYEDGLTGVEDPAFKDSFTDIYTAPSLKERWYTADIVDFFFVDTTPFQDKYFNETDHTYDWRGVLPRKTYLSNLLKDVNEALKKSTASWKFVIGHHPIMSAGHHGNSEELVAQLLPILEENNVDLYINGHDHCLEQISSPDSPLQFLTSGGGSKAWSGDVKPWNPEELKLYYDGQGFMSIQVTQTRVDVMAYDIFGNILHKWSRAKPGF